MSINGVFGPSISANSVVVGSNAGSAGAVNIGAITATTYITQLQAINLPAGKMGQNGQLDIEIDLANASASVANLFWLSFGGHTAGPVLSLSSVLAQSTLIRIRNAGTTNAQVVTVTNNGTTTFQSMSVDTSISQQLLFLGQLGTSTGQMSLNGWRVTVTNPSATATPSPVVAGSKIFYGINHHYTYWPTPSASDMVAIMQSAGFGCMRLTYEGRSATVAGTTCISILGEFATKLKAAGLELQVCIDVSMESTPGTAFSSEALCYAKAFSQGAYVATNLGPLGVSLFECGNELDSKTAGGIAIRWANNTGTQGTVFQDFSASATVFAGVSVFSLMRGAIRGAYDGVKSVLPNAKCLSNAFTNASIYASDALWNGWEPDGTTGHPQVRWDITNWHLYTQGDARNTVYSGGGGQPSFDLLQYIHNAYGVPIAITEYNPAQSTASNQAIVQTWLQSWYSAQDTLNIATVTWYDFFDSPYQIINNDISPYTLNSVGVAIQTFIANNPARK